MHPINANEISYYDSAEYPQVSETYLQADVYDSAEATLPLIAAAKIGILDSSILMFMWVLVLATTATNLGRVPGILFFALNVLLVLKRPINGFLVLLLLWFTPNLLFIPRPFVVSAIIAMIGYIFHGVYAKYPPFFLNKMVWAAFAFTLFAGVGVLIVPNVGDGTTGLYRVH